MCQVSHHACVAVLLQVKADAAITSKLKYLLVPRGNLTDNGHLQSMEEGRPVTVTLPRDKAEGLAVLGVDSMFEVIDLCLMPGAVQTRHALLPTCLHRPRPYRLIVDKGEELTGGLVDVMCHVTSLWP